MKTILNTALIFLIGIGAAYAQTSARPADIVRAEQYLNGLNTARARFVQTAHNGAQVIGNFYLNRPGKLRFEYDDPIEDFVVADGFLIYFYDADLGEQTNAPIGQTLADFLLRPDIRLDGEIKVTDISRSADLLQITLVQRADPEAGALSLGFTQNPFQLKKWRVTDSSGAITEIELFKMESGIRLDDNLFVYADPSRFGGQTRYNYNE